MVTAHALITQLLDRKIMLDDFSVAIAEAASGLAEHDDSPRARDLWHVSLLLAEYTSGHLTRFELHDALATMIVSG